MARITGRVEILVNSKLLLSKSGATASGIGISGKPPFERKPVMGDTGLHGFTEEPVPAQLEVTVTDRDDIMLDTLANINGNGTMIFRNAGGGKVYTAENVFCTNNLSVVGGEGEVKLTFVGTAWTESVEAAV